MPNSLRNNTTSTPESYALNIIANMLVYFKYGQPDGLTDNDIWDSYNELRESPANQKDMTDSLLISMGQAMQVFGDERRKNVEELRNERLAKIDKVQKATEDTIKAIEADKKFSDMSRVTIGALYAEAETNDGYLFAKDFSNEFWKKVLEYRELVHQYLPQIEESDNVLYSKGSVNSDRVYFLNPFYQDARNYGSAEKYASTPLKYSKIDDTDLNLLYMRYSFDGDGNRINLGCYVTVGSREVLDTDKSHTRLGDGNYATLNGILINDGTDRPSYYEQMLGIGIGLLVKQGASDDDYVLIGNGSLLFDVGLKYTRFRVNNSELFSTDYNPFEEGSVE